MLFAQLGGAHSLREICGGLATALGRLNHLGLNQAPSRSTLSYANANRPWKLYEDVFYTLLGRCHDVASSQKRRFRFKNPLRSLDSSTIDLCLSAFDWAHFRRAKGAIKLHLLLDHQGCLPCWALVTDGKTHDVRPARTLTFDPGTIVAMDRAYVDYALFAKWTEANVYFVTRAKSNMDYRVIEIKDVPDRNNVLSDELIELAGPRGSVYPHRLRRVVVWDPEKEKEIVLLSNIMHLAASTIGAIYKDRWQIELFFKAIKQNLKLKTFVGTSENAVKVQVWTALIAMLLLKFLQLKSSFGWSLSTLAAMLRMNLLTYRDLWAWLDDPFNTPRREPPPEVQLSLF
jgi:IS4 transposase